MSQSPNRKTGFTLVELLVVMGLMAFLATISTAGYFAVTRGMAARGAIQDVASIIRYAQQTCLIDQTPTAVLFYNYRTGNSTKDGDAYGRAIAVRMSGRVSWIANDGRYSNASSSIGSKVMVDEYADWNQSFPRLEGDDVNDKSLGVRIYHMGNVMQEKGYKNCSSVMYNGVVVAQGMEGEMLMDVMMRWEFTGNFAGLCGDGNLEAWCSNRDRPTNYYRWGLPFQKSNGGLPAGQWHVGDAYGMEIASFTLPKNYIFGGKAPSNADPTDPSSSPRALVFMPDQVKSSSSYEFSSVKTVTISMLMDAEGKKVSTVGKIDSSILKDQD